MQDYKKLKNNLALKKIDLGKLKYKISDIINKYIEGVSSI